MFGTTLSLLTSGQIQVWAKILLSLLFYLLFILLQFFTFLRKELKIFYLIFLFLLFLFYLFYFLDLGLRFSMMLYVAFHSHIITYHKEYYRRFWNNNIIPHINDIQYTYPFRIDQVSIVQTISQVYIRQTLCNQNSIEFSYVIQYKVLFIL